MKRTRLPKPPIGLAKKYKIKDRECSHCGHVFPMTAKEIKAHWEECIREDFATGGKKTI